MESIFAIFRQLPEAPSKFKFVGNGFFINKKGTFITVGHNFSYEGKFYITQKINNDNLELIPIEKHHKCHKTLYEERKHYHIERDATFQRGPEYKDIAVGIVNLNNSSSFLNIEKKRSFELDALSVSYYIRNENFDINGIYAIDGKLPNSCLDWIPPINLSLKDRKELAIIPYTGFDSDSKDKYNNCLVLEGKTNKGGSGAPIINQRGNIIGMLEGGNCEKNITSMILSKYMLKKAKKLHKSHFSKILQVQFIKKQYSLKKQNTRF